MGQLLRLAIEAVTKAINTCKAPYHSTDFNIVFQGASFRTISDQTDIFEGSIIRFLRRLDELLGQLLTASNVSP